jgi:ABC-2 type transport system ATP-binding protein
VTVPIIELVNLTKKYGSFTAVDQLNLTVGKGEVFGLLGPNGAGKTTTILMMLGLTEPSSGSVTVCGIDSTRNPIEVKRRVGYLPDEIGFYDDRSGFENLMYTARLNRISDKEAKQKAEDLLVRVGLEDVINKKTGKYSHGMRQRLGLADVLIKKPEVIILDEPTSGIDPKGVREFLELIVQLRNEEGLTVLFSSHNLHQVQQVCDRVGIFVNGKLRAEGNIQTLSQKLKNSSFFQIEVGIDESIPGSSHSSIETEVSRLEKLLQPVEGFSSIILKNGIFQIKCSHDLSSEIAKIIVEAGIRLNFLNKKEYELDDIYNRFFERGDCHE